MVKRGEKFRELIGRSQGAYSLPTVPAREEVYRPYERQLNFFSYFGNEITSSEAGLFFELLSQAIYGGELVDSVSSYGSGAMSRFPRVDIVDIPNRVARECKSSFYGKELILRDEQVGNYDACQAGNPDYRFVVDIFKHGMPKVRGFSGKVRELFRELASNVGYGVSLDYLLLKEISNNAFDHMTDDKKPFATRAEVSTYRDSTRLTPRLFNGLFENPEEILTRLGIDVNGVEINRGFVSKPIYVFSLPKEEVAGLNGEAEEHKVVVPSFPVLSMHYRDYDSKLGEFLDDFLGSEGRGDLEKKVEQKSSGGLEELPF